MARRYSDTDTVTGITSFGLHAPFPQPFHGFVFSSSSRRDGMTCGRAAPERIPTLWSEASIWFEWWAVMTATRRLSRAQGGCPYPIRHAPFRPPGGCTLPDVDALRS